MHQLLMLLITDRGVTIYRGVAIYTKRYLNARSYLTNVKDFEEHACRKIEMSDKTSLYILSFY